MNRQRRVVRKLDLLQAETGRTRRASAFTKPTADRSSLNSPAFGKSFRLC